MTICNRTCFDAIKKRQLMDLICVQAVSTQMPWDSNPGHTLLQYHLPQKRSK